MSLWVTNDAKGTLSELPKQLPINAVVSMGRRNTSSNPPYIENKS